MRILYDHQRFSVQNVGGITRYFYELINELKKLEEIEVDLSILFSNNQYIKEYSMSFLRNHEFKGKRYLIYKINTIKSLIDLKTKKYDLFHPTYYDNYFLPFINKKFVVTVYDMCHELFINKNNYLNDKTSINKRNLIYKSSKIIAISENTKNDIIKLYKDIDRNKINVIYNANSLVDSSIEKIDIPSKYLLYVGHRNDYKNFKNLAKAFSKLLNKNNELFLVCVGGGSFSKEEILFLKEINILNNTITLNVNDNQLVYLYKNALAFVFPSFYEGFGIPILESFYSHCPVILSNSSCFPEIAQDCAEYFDPNDVNEIQYKIEKVINDNNLRQRLIEKGLIRLKDFSWKKTSLKTKELYYSVISS